MFDSCHGCGFTLDQCLSCGNYFCDECIFDACAFCGILLCEDCITPVDSGDTACRECHEKYNDEVKEYEL